MLLNKLAVKANQLPVSEVVVPSGVARYMSRHGKADMQRGSTVSAVAGTTLHLISHHWANGVSVFDTPGLIPETPTWPLNQRIRPVSYITEQGRALSLGESVLATPVKGGSVLVSCFLPGDIPLRLQQADETLPGDMVLTMALESRQCSLLTVVSNGE